MRIRTLSFVVIAILCAGTAGAQQQRRITGTVAAREGGAPLTSASVTVVGTTNGSYTGTDGKFSVLAPATTVSLRIRRIGYQARTIVVTTSQNDVTVALERDVLQLEAQVVTGTSTAVASENAANAVTVISSEARGRSFDA